MSQTEKSSKKKREKSNSAEMTTGRHRQVQSASFTKGGSLLQQPQQAVIDHSSSQPQGNRNNIPKLKQRKSQLIHDLDSTAHSYYYPTPAPETVVVHTVPKKTNDACCWGW